MFFGKPVIFIPNCDDKLELIRLISRSCFRLEESYGVSENFEFIIALR